MSDAEDYFSGTFRMDYEGQDPDSLVALYYLQTAGYGCEPLVFHTREGGFQRPASSIHSYDEGSVPRRLQGLVSPNAWARAYAMHDCSYINHGWWELVNGVWTFQLKTRHQVDEMLIRWLLATGCGRDEAYACFEGVLFGGGDIWAHHTGPFPVGPFIV